MSGVAFAGLAIGIGVVICASTTLCYCCCKRIIKNHEKKEEKHKKLSERNSTKTDSPKQRKKKKKHRTRDTIIDIERSASADTADSQSDSNTENYRMKEMNYSSGLGHSVSSHYYSNSYMNGNVEVTIEPSSRELSKSSQLSNPNALSQSPSTDDDSTNAGPASPPHIIILSQSQNPQVTPIPSLPSTPQKNPLAVSMNPKLRTSAKMPIGKAKGVRSYEVLPGLQPQQQQPPPFNPLEEATMKNLQKEFQQKLKLSRKGSAFNIAKQNQQFENQNTDSNNDIEYVQAVSAPQSPRLSNKHTHIKDVRKSFSFPAKFPDEANESSEESFESAVPALPQDDSYTTLPSMPTTRVSSPSKPPTILQIDSITSYYNDSEASFTRSTSEDSKTSEIDVETTPVRTSVNNSPMRASVNNNNNNNRSKLRGPVFQSKEDDSDGVEYVPKEEAKKTPPPPAEVVMTLPNHTLDLWQQVTKQ